MVDVIEALKQQRLAAVKKSISFSEAHERRVISRAAQAKAVITGESPHAGSPHFREYVMRDLYNKQLEAYTRKSVFTTEMNPRALALWKRAVAACLTSKVDPETYIKAQFTYFHNTFKTYPTVLQLTTDAAIVRAASVKPETVVSNNIAAEIDMSTLFRSCEKQMNEIMRAQQLTREQVYRRLVIPRLVMFPQAYLDADPLWKKVKSEG